MLAARNGHKDVILTLLQRGAHLDLVKTVSVHLHILYYKTLASTLEATLEYNKNLFLL